MDNEDPDDRPIEVPIGRHPGRRGRNGGSQQKPSSSQDEPQVFQPRDPRFDPRCPGTNDVNHFLKNYGFIDDIRRDEIAKLESALRKEKDPEKKSKIKATIQRTRNKMVERQNKCKKIELIQEMKRDDRRDKNITQPGKPRHNINIKKSDLKKKLLVNKYKELKESGKLSKYLERKRKKLISRDEKAFIG